MNQVTELDATRLINDLVRRRPLLGKAGAASLGALLATFGANESAGAFAAVPPPTSYSTLLGVCTQGSGTTTFTPGITNTLQAIHVDASVTFPSCAVAQNKVITRYTSSLDTISSCSNKTDASGTGAIFYSDGQTSTWILDSWSTTRLLGQSLIVNSGLITKGVFNGARFWHFVILTHNNPAACATGGGITNSTDTTTLIIANP